MTKEERLKKFKKEYPNWLSPFIKYDDRRKIVRIKRYLERNKRPVTDWHISRMLAKLYPNLKKKNRDPNLIYYWRKELRDKYEKCCECGSIERLEADHILPVYHFPEYAYYTWNGRILCRDCHKETDSYGGRCRSKTKEYFKEKYSYLLELNLQNKV